MSGRLLIAAAGTGGHVTPALAVARRLRAQGWEIAWLGTEGGIERSLLAADAIPLQEIALGGIRGKGRRELLAGPWRVLRATASCLARIRRFAPDVVLVSGGRIAVPAGYAARLAGRPLAFLHADAEAQLSLRLLGPLPARVLCGFAGGAARLAGARARLTGIPVRPEIAALAPPGQRYGARASATRQILVLGGSLGARALNEALPAALARLPAAERPQVLHQCGREHVAATATAYARAGVQASVQPFIVDVAGALARADLVVARAGAITCAELCAAGVASVLVPLVVRTTRHQEGNARELARHGAAIHLPQAQAHAEQLAPLLATPREALLRMAEAARGLARPLALEAVAGELAALAGLASQAPGSRA